MTWKSINSGDNIDADRACESKTAGIRAKYKRERERNVSGNVDMFPADAQIAALSAVRFNVVFRIDEFPICIAVFDYSAIVLRPSIISH